jgi:hypothetical protein
MLERKNWFSSYVKAIVEAYIHQLQFIIGDELVNAFDYRIPIIPWH